MNTRGVGSRYEQTACDYLTDKGYKILERNYRNSFGEIDIIALDKDEIVFIEVKTRTSQKYGFAAEAVDDNKKRHLLNSIRYYVYSRNLQNEFIRIDVIEVYINNGKRTINHIKQAI